MAAVGPLVLAPGRIPARSRKRKSADAGSCALGHADKHPPPVETQSPPDQC